MQSKRQRVKQNKSAFLRRGLICLVAVCVLIVGGGCAVTSELESGIEKIVSSSRGEEHAAGASRPVPSANDAPTEPETAAPAPERTTRGATRDEPSGGQLGAPERHKTLTENRDENGVWDGSYTLTLDVTGKMLEQKERKKADVIVIFDTSMSMTSDRINTARSALRTLAQQLYENNTEEEPDTITMSLIPFNTRVGSVSEGMETMAEFETALSRLPSRGTGGTNWEEVLQAADRVSVREDADPYIIFVSDGNPTFHVTDGGYNNYNPRYGLYGTGMEMEPNITYCYEQAKDDARQIVLNGKEFFAVSVFGNISRMQDIVNYAYGGSVEGHYYSSQDGAAIQAAFADIVTGITREWSYTNVVLFDEMSSLAGVLDNNGTPDFTYYKNGEVWADAPPATYDPQSGIVWDLSSEGKLAAETTYSVSFTVWPDQNALDDITDFMNGTKPYDPETYPDIIQNDDGSYSVYSNASGGITYTETETVDGEEIPGPTQTVEYERPVMTASGAVIRIRKQWEDDLDPSQRPTDENGVTLPVTLTILRDGEPFAEVTLSDDNGWEQELYIAPGLISTDISEDPLNAGHDYTVSEEGIDPRYELVSETIHPMLVNGALGYGGDGDGVLAATNRLKGGVRIRKIVENAAHYPDESFSFILSLTSAAGEPLADTQEGYILYRDGTTSEPIAVRDGDTITLKAGETFEIPRLPAGTVYTVREDESAMPEGFYLSDVLGEEILVDFSVSDVIRGNEMSEAVFKNRWRPTLRICKEDPDGQVIPGVVFRLTPEDGGGEEQTTDINGVASFTDLPDGGYTLTETVTAQGYALPEESWIVTVTDGEITIGGNASLTGELTCGDGIWSVTVKNGRIAVLPAAGGRGIKYLTIIGAWMMLLAAGVICLVYRDKNKVEK